MSSSNPNTSIFAFIFILLLLSSLSIACIALLSENLSIFSQVDQTMLTFINDNLCVDGPLRYAFRVTQDQLLYQLTLHRAALACVVIAYLIQLVAVLFKTDVYYLWTCRSSLSDLMVRETQQLTAAAPANVLNAV
jgi:hypothetical protein